MHIGTIFIFLTFFFNFSTCRDFYLGMFKKNDLLVAQDTLYKEKVPYRFSFAKYGRKFHCPITYVRVEDRLNVGRGPRVQIIRGGLRRKILVLRVTSPYNHPISANIYVGCANNKKFTNPPFKIIRPTKKASITTTTVASGNGTETNDDGSTDATTPGGGGDNTSVGADKPSGDATGAGDADPTTVEPPAEDAPPPE